MIENSGEEASDSGPRQNREVQFVEPAMTAPVLTKRPSGLNRSNTLMNFASSARTAARGMNYYHDFNHHNWFLSIRWIFKGSGVNMFLPLGIVMVFATVSTIIIETLHMEQQVDLGTDVTTGLGGCMALLLAFRLNVCYSRWWEGRLLWGRVIESSRSLVTIALSLEADVEPNSPEARERRRSAEGLAGWCIAFAVALKCHLREVKIQDSVDERMRRSIQRLLVNKGLAFGSTAFERLNASAHPPLHALRSVRHAIRRILDQHSPSGRLALENLLNQLSGELHGALTGCERILRTPCPPGYVGVLRLSLVFFLLLLPFVLLEIGYWLIPVVFMTSFVLLGAEEVAIQLEQPFGDDQNDLPLDSYCFNLEADLISLLDEKIEGPPAEFGR